MIWTALVREEASTVLIVEAIVTGDLVLSLTVRSVEVAELPRIVSISLPAESISVRVLFLALLIVSEPLPIVNTTSEPLNSVSVTVAPREILSPLA